MDSKYLAWVDIETTGLDPKTCVILEVAIAITDTSSDLKVVDEFSTSIHINKRQLVQMNEWCLGQHTGSGLVATDGAEQLYVPGGICINEAEEKCVAFMKKYLCARKIKSHMGGSSVHFDRAFLKEHMPDLESCFHYRNLDVSSIQKFMKLAGNHQSIRTKGDCSHRALADINDSIQWMRDYLEVVK